MNNKTNYALVGFFVIVGFVLLGSFMYWLMKPDDEMKMKKYVIYFNESVLGLHLDSPVKYRGIDVGKVVKLGINPKNSEQVRVVVSVEKITPIKTTTVAKLTAQGITGLSYINLSLGDKNAPLLTKVPKGERYPVIRTVPSFFENVQTSFGKMYKKLSKTLDAVDGVLQKQNQKEFSRLLKESADLMARLNATLDDATIKNIHASVANIQNVTRQLDATMPQVKRLVQNSIVWEHNMTSSMREIVSSYLEMKQVAAKFGDAIESGEFDLRSITNEFLPSLNKSLNSLNGVLQEFHSAIKQYKRSPRDLLFKEVEVKKGPGE